MYCISKISYIRYFSTTHKVISYKRLTFENIHPSKYSFINRETSFIQLYSKICLEVQNVVHQGVPSANSSNAALKMRAYCVLIIFKMLPSDTSYRIFLQCRRPNLDYISMQIFARYVCRNTAPYNTLSTSYSHGRKAN